MAFVEVELLVRTGCQGFAQGAVGGEFEVVEQVRQPKLMGFLGPGVQNGLGGSRHQERLAGCLGRELTGGEKAVHVTQANERFAQARGQGDAGQLPPLDGGQHLVLQDLLAQGGNRSGLQKGGIRKDRKVAGVVDEDPMRY